MTAAPLAAARASRRARGGSALDDARRAQAALAVARCAVERVRHDLAAVSWARRFPPSLPEEVDESCSRFFCGGWPGGAAAGAAMSTLLSRPLGGTCALMRRSGFAVQGANRARSSARASLSRLRMAAAPGRDKRLRSSERRRVHGPSAERSQWSKPCFVAAGPRVNLTTTPSRCS